ncbi:HipA domain-containing protein [Nocardia mangyaensis]|uniref:HipA domain-containing protein n=1 Tax=Nocardia mangyaensis TaxID=2213200 RepID=UPI002676D07F|nr:HipA domain-containing protein [Nocardia mangyaensis]MDO3650430.1 HipA domain-containing protein [Nocardia mangyaensis]
MDQEDFCQALGLDPDAKYESTAESERLGSRLGRLAPVAADRAIVPQAFRVDLLSAVTFNVIMGNGDAHSKNYSLLLGRRGEVSLAPLPVAVEVSRSTVRSARGDRARSVRTARWCVRSRRVGATVRVR